MLCASRRLVHSSDPEPLRRTHGLEKGRIEDAPPASRSKWSFAPADAARASATPPPTTAQPQPGTQAPIRAARRGDSRECAPPSKNDGLCRSLLTPRRRRAGRSRLSRCDLALDARSEGVGEENRLHPKCGVEERDRRSWVVWRGRKTSVLWVANAKAHSPSRDPGRRRSPRPAGRWQAPPERDRKAGAAPRQRER